MTLRLWPRSLAARTALVLLVGLVIVQAAGLAIHALDRIDLQRLAQARDVALRVVGAYRIVMTTPADRRQEVLSQLRRPPGLTAELTSDPPIAELADGVPFGQRIMRVNLNMVPLKHDFFTLTRRMGIPARLSFGFKVLAGVEASLHGSSLLVGPERAGCGRGGWRHEPGGSGAPVWGQPFLGDPMDEAG